jgi:hypothetical protein
VKLIEKQRGFGWIPVVFVFNKRITKKRGISLNFAMF